MPVCTTYLRKTVGLYLTKFNFSLTPLRFKSKITTEIE